MPDQTVRHPAIHLVEVLARLLFQPPPVVEHLIGCERRPVALHFGRLELVVARAVGSEPEVEGLHDEVGREERREQPRDLCRVESLVAVRVKVGLD